MRERLQDREQWPRDTEEREHTWEFARDGETEGDWLWCEVRAETAKYEAGTESNGELDSGIGHTKPEAETEADEQACERDDKRSCVRQ